VKDLKITKRLLLKKSGKGQWGEVTIAVDNESVINLLNDNVIGILYLTTREEWEKEKALEEKKCRPYLNGSAFSLTWTD